MDRKIKRPNQKPQTARTPNRISRNQAKTRTIERARRKERRKLLKMDVWLDDHATRRMDARR